MLYLTVPVLPVVQRRLLQLLVVTTFASQLVLQVITVTGSTMLIICGMVSSVELSREGVVELLVYHGSTRHYILPPVTILNCNLETSDKNVSVDLYKIYVK